jgi:WxcM-like, C-terminal
LPLPRAADQDRRRPAPGGSIVNRPAATSANEPAVVLGRPRPLRNGYEWVDLPRIPDHRGSLTVIEGGRQVPFEIARVYYLYDVPAAATRAGHAHHRLTQLIIAASGSFKVNIDNGFERASLRLDRPYRGLLLRPMMWRTIDEFSGGALCLVIASIPYDEADYIHDYEAFLRLCRGGA